MADYTQLRCIAVDARCLQDPDYAERGVGRHTVNLLRRAPHKPENPLIGVFDPLMPDMAPSVSALFDAVRPNAQFRELHHNSCFVSLSPMTHDSLFVARLLRDPRPLKAAVVYDFIPYEFPKQYLANAPLRHAYYVCLHWLSRYDLFLPISLASAASLRTLLGVVDDRVVVTGAALDAIFEMGGRSAHPSHVLVIGGDDPRKNVECAIRAHAVSNELQAARVSLVITGNYSPERKDEFRNISESLGGVPHLTQMPGHVSDADLVDLYRDAICVVAPSRAEGFDLAVVEAMAIGAPVLASDIPAHCELVQDASCRFEPDDHVRLSGLIAAIAAAPELRGHIVADQASSWPRYRAAAVADRFWNAIKVRLSASGKPAIQRRRRPRLALLSPLPPDHSGVADYTAATCAELGRMTELHVFSETAAPAAVAGAATVRPLSAIPSISAHFDGVVNVIGNSARFHRRIFDQLLRYGGACIAHDSRMLGFYRHIGMERATGLASKELGRPVGPTEIDGWLADEASLEALHLGEIIVAADPMVVHSPVTARVLRERYGIAPVVLPFCIYRSWRDGQLAGRDAARRRLALPDDEVVIATFGSVGRTKAPLECISALEILRGWGIDASLHFVGADAEEHTLDRTARELDLSDKVKFIHGYVTEEVYRDYLVAADLGVQLRMTYFGSLSGALLDCVGAGLPTVTNDSLAEAMGAPAYVRSVPDKISPLLVAQALAELLDQGLAKSRPEAARKAFSDERSFRIYAMRLCEALGLEGQS
jgi:glycosyltransferase involved in cell wall biosynthesis